MSSIIIYNSNSYIYVFIIIMNEALRLTCSSCFCGTRSINANLSGLYGRRQIPNSTTTILWMANSSALTEHATILRSWSRNRRTKLCKGLISPILEFMYTHRQFWETSAYTRIFFITFNSLFNVAALSYSFDDPFSVLRNWISVFCLRLSKVWHARVDTSLR